MSDCFTNGDARVGGSTKKGCMAAFLVMLSIVGCAGKQPVVPPANQLEAIRHNQRGIKAEARGDSRRALEEFSEAVRINRSIENNEGVAVALVNSSRVYRRNGDAKSALAAIGMAIPLVATRDRLYPEVAFEMSQSLLLSEDPDAALEWASTAAGAESSAKRGMMLNLVARILCKKKDYAEAGLKAREALLLNRESGARDEEANSLRTIGDILTTTGANAEAAHYYHQALAIDKALAKSSKIAADLRGLALVSSLQKDNDKALDFYRRAFAVSSAGGDQSGSADDLLKMARIHETRGEREQAEFLMIKRGKILSDIRMP